MGGKQSAETTAKVVEGSNAAKAEKPNAKQEQKSHGHAPKGDVTVIPSSPRIARVLVRCQPHPDTAARANGSMRRRSVRQPPTLTALSVLQPKRRSVGFMVDEF